MDDATTDGLAMRDSHFQHLLDAARSQPESQRLLFVFAEATLPADATAAQRAGFEAGEGGALEPVMCVDKDPHALANFDDLAAQSRHTGAHWDVVFVAGLAGSGRRLPSEAQTRQALDGMVERIRNGRLDPYAAYDAQGQPLGFS